MKIGAHLRLMRFHKPSGIFLLWLPTAWALWVANQGAPALRLVMLFFAGTVLMRAAGCVVNDIADRHIDKHVKRTSLRPLTSGEVGIVEAFVTLFFLLLGAFFVVIQLPLQCFYYAMVALGLTVLYPFCKRFFDAPQLILGLAFSMGIPMAYAASGVPVDRVMCLLMTLNFAWIVAYDTMYAMADKEDDLLIGVRSTAILFGHHAQLIIFILQLYFHLVWLVLAITLHWCLLFYVIWTLALGVLAYQQYLIGKQRAACYLTAFSTNVIYGFLMWGALFNL